MTSKAVQKNITIETYSPKSFAVRGSDTKKHKDKLRKMGGRWNRNLKNGAGWIFSHKKRAQVEKMFEGNKPIKTEKKKVPADQKTFFKHAVMNEWNKLVKTQIALQTYTLEWSTRMTTTAGKCCMSKKVIRLSTRMIEHPTTRLNDVVNTVRHEAAHAICSYTYGNKVSGHGKEWKSIAISIGCNGERCHSMSFAEASEKWAIKCTVCCNNWFSVRKPAKTSVCGNCEGTLLVVCK